MFRAPHLRLREEGVPDRRGRGGEDEEREGTVKKDCKQAGHGTDQGLFGLL